MANARLGSERDRRGDGGARVRRSAADAVGAPFLFLFDAIINIVAAVLQSRITVDEPAAHSARSAGTSGTRSSRGCGTPTGTGTLRPLALSVHIWFLGNSIVVTVFAVFVLRELELAPWALGIALAFTGIGGFLGALVAPRLGERLGAGRAILLGRTLVVLPWLALAVLPLEPATGLGVLLVVVCAAQFVYGLTMGIEDANDMGYRQAVAPGTMQGRMNSTIRTANRAVFFVGALLAGVLATFLGYPVTLGIAAAIFAVAALVVAVSPLRNARHDDAGEPS